MIATNYVRPKAAAKHEFLFNKPTPPLLQILWQEERDMSETIAGIMVLYVLL